MNTVTEAVVFSDTVDNNVVQNDKATDATSSANAVELLETLEQQRKNWEVGAYRTSNQMLYAILSQCLQFGGNLDTTEANKVRREALEAFYKQRSYRWKKDTPLMTKVVRAVFGDIDRRRLSTYSLVLRRAKLVGVLPSRFADWVESENGIQEIRLGNSATFISPKTKAATAQQRFEQMDKLAVVKTEQLSQLANPDSIGEQCLLVATQEADGSFTVRAVVKANSAVSAAFASIYQAQQAKAEKLEKDHKAAIEAAVKAELEASKQLLAA